MGYSLPNTEVQTAWVISLSYSVRARDPKPGLSDTKIYALSIIYGTLVQHQNSHFFYYFMVPIGLMDDCSWWVIKIQVNYLHSS